MYTVKLRPFHTQSEQSMAKPINFKLYQCYITINICKLIKYQRISRIKKPKDPRYPVQRLPYPVM